MAVSTPELPHGMNMTVYEVRMDHGTGEWRVLFLMDRLMDDGHFHPFDNTTDDDYGYYHSYSWGMASTLRGSFPGVSFTCTDSKHGSIEMPGEWMFTDSFYQLSCPWPDYPFLPPTNSSMILYIHHPWMGESLSIPICVHTLPMVSVSLCSAILLDDSYRSQVVHYIEHHLELGIERFYVFDRTGAYRPLLESYIQQGVVEFQVIPIRDASLQVGTRIYNDQLPVFELCKYRNIGLSSWIIMLDWDEWLHFPPESSPFATVQPFLSAVSDRAHSPLVPTPAKIRSREFEDASLLESTYAWWIPLNFYIFSGPRDNNDTSLPLPMQFLHRQALFRHIWAFKCFLRPHLPTELLDQWAQQYRHLRPYPQNDHIEDGQRSYATMHRLDHLHYDDPRARHPAEVGFAHYLSANRPRQWMMGGEANVTDESVSWTLRNRYQRMGVTL